MTESELDRLVEITTGMVDTEIAAGAPLGAWRRLEVILNCVVAIVKERTPAEPPAWQGASTIAGAMRLFDEHTEIALQDFEREHLDRAFAGEDHVHLDDLSRALAAAREASARERLKVEHRLRAEKFPER